MKPLHELSLTEASAGIARRRFSPAPMMSAARSMPLCARFGMKRANKR
jgi:hypothetical protein